MKKRYSRKDILDKFYTKPDVAKRLVENIDFVPYDLVIEPAAGNGSFVDAIPKSVLAFDIAPGRNDIIKQDFFTVETGVSSEKVIVIGNPPFGKQNNLALRFINYASALADTVAFILPLSFNKASIQNKVCLEMNLYSTQEIEKNAFLFEGEEYDVPTVFQIWKRGAPRLKVNPPNAIGWRYVTRDGDLAIRRVGYYAGRASKNLNLNKESHLFIEVENKGIIDDLEKYLSTYDWQYKDTVGPRTVSKYQLNKVINDFLRYPS